MTRMHVLLSLTVPLLFTVKENEVAFSFQVNHKNHTQIFNYLSRAENFPLLNPTIYRLRVVNGSKEEFTIQYDEYLSHFPCITNSGTAHYKLVRHDGNGPHEIQSNHSTCFIGDYFCLPTVAVVRISPTEDSMTSYEEAITYNCPWILTAFCLKEIFFQRMAIMNGVESVFGARKHC